MTAPREIVWFSCGAPSAVMAKLCPDAELVYCDTGSEHPDNARFLKDVERWCDRPVTVLRSPRFMPPGATMDMTASLTAAGAATHFRHGRDIEVPYSHFIPMEAPGLVAEYVNGSLEG